MKVVVTTKNFCDEARQYLETHGFTVTVYRGGNLGARVKDEELYEIVKDADVIIAGTETYSPALLSRLKNLKLISRNGIGYDAIDLNKAQGLGIGLVRTTGFVEAAVAEQVMAYMLYFSRRIDLQNELMHQGKWLPKLESGAKGKTLGLVGFGGIGKEVAKRSVPFGLKTLFYCRHPEKDDEAAKQLGAQYSDLENLLANSDYVCACIPLTDHTVHFFDEEKISQMKNGACLINIARGPVVDEKALYRALKNKKLSSCAVDVYDHEPCTDSILKDCETAVLTPHTASSTVESSREMNLAAAHNVVNYMNEAIEDKYVVLKGKRGF